MAEWSAWPLQEDPQARAPEPGETASRHMSSRCGQVSTHAQSMDKQPQTETHIPHVAYARCIVTASS
ncbi:MAG: hypothetical protein PHP20_09950, partial [Firmicutes bacterium]|nr:hypothetical protein [Bacillota bacterium]